MVLPPFKNEQMQRLCSVLVLILGVLLMIAENIRVIHLAGIAINMFVVGVIVAFIGFFYFMDV